MYFQATSAQLLDLALDWGFMWKKYAALLWWSAEEFKILCIARKGENISFYYHTCSSLNMTRSTVRIRLIFHGPPIFELLQYLKLWLIIICNTFTNAKQATKMQKNYQQMCFLLKHENTVTIWHFSNKTHIIWAVFMYFRKLPYFFLKIKGSVKKSRSFYGNNQSTI